MNLKAKVVSYRMGYRSFHSSLKCLDAYFRPWWGSIFSQMKEISVNGGERVNIIIRRKYFSSPK